MIIRIIATALIQCTVRSHAGWTTLVWAGMALVSLAARLDIAIPRLFHLFEPGTPSIRRELRLRYCLRDDKIDTRRLSSSQKCEPGCPGSRSRIPVGTRPGRAGCQDGIRTVSTTWMTPFD